MLGPVPVPVAARWAAQGKPDGQMSASMLVSSVAAKETAAAGVVQILKPIVGAIEHLIRRRLGSDD